MNPFPNCPKCGTPAHVAVLLKARVRFSLDNNGHPDKPLSLTREAPAIDGYECRGGHYWPREEGVRGIHPPEGVRERCPRCNGTKRDPEHEGPCGACTTTLQGAYTLPKECLARMGPRTCHKPHGHDGPHHDPFNGTHWNR